SPVVPPPQLHSSCPPLSPGPAPVSAPRCPCPRVPIPSPSCGPHPALFPTAAKSKGKGAPKEVLKGPEVCTDPTMLATHAMGVNYFKEGPEVALKPESEYPDWLFKIHLGPPKKLEELDPNSLEYWRRLRKYNTWQRNKLRKGKKL
uniref:Large ribosomal subunit protein mL54 n=1 Tax=Taeniopygia guttata TaxID=59729 RepID=A0A674GXJ6_TAEGU